jgi:predicted nucleotidyltransferase component of viral defense system
MITKDEIEAKAREFEIHEINVERDYVFGWLLAAIYSVTDLQNVLILKGGGAFRKGYFESTRFTGDLDFSAEQAVDPEALARELNRACQFVQETAGIEFYTNETRVEEKRLVQLRNEPSKIIHAARLYFRDFYGDRDHLVVSVRMDITEFDRIALPVQTRNLIHPYSDTSACRATIRCVKLEELLATKLKCLLQRRRANDLYDYIYSVFIRHEIAVNRSEVIQAFFSKTIFRPEPAAAKNLLLGLPFEKFRAAWDKFLVVPKQVWINFEDALGRFRESIDELFGNFGFSRQSLAFFPAEYRNPIMDAASTMTLLRFTYDTVPRLVEPYALVYKRRQDGVGQEYFYAYDRTGGRTSGPDIKSFLARGVQAIETTDEKFEPRYPVELAKAGEPSEKGYFGAPFSSRQRAARRSYRQAPFRARSRPTYVLECPYCFKRFERSSRTTQLRQHSDKYGNRCFGRIGTIVGQK